MLGVRATVEEMCVCVGGLDSRVKEEIGSRRTYPASSLFTQPAEPLLLPRPAGGPLEAQEPGARREPP